MFCGGRHYSPQHFVAVLRTKTKNRAAHKLETPSAAKGDLLCKVETKPVRQILKATMAVQNYPAGDARVAQRLSELFHKKSFSSFFEWEHVHAH